MMRAFQELFERLGLKRAKGKRFFALEAELHDELMEQAGIEKRKLMKIEEYIKKLPLTG